jgi:hypothetical protein
MWRHILFLLFIPAVRARLAYSFPMNNETQVDPGMAVIW